MPEETSKKVELRLSDDEKALLTTLRELRQKSFNDARLDSPEVRDNIVNFISSVLVSDILGFNEADDDYASKVTAVMSNKSPVRAYAVSFATALMVGYFQSFNNDIAIDGEPPEFGYGNLSTKFTAVIADSLSERLPADASVSALESGFCVRIRTNCSAREYFSGNLYHDDIKLLGKMLTADINDGYNVKMLSAISGSSDIGSKLDSYIDDIESVYALLFEDGFGVESYEGVLFSEKSFITIEDGASIGSTIKKAAGTLGKFSRRVLQKVGSSIEISDARQFDYDKIFKSTKTVYFPRKILEYALGRESTLNMTQNVYKNSDNGSSWGAYYSTYVKKNIKDILERAVYRALERVKKLDFISDAFMRRTTDYEDFIIEACSDEVVSSEVDKLLDKVARSVKCAFILTRYPVLANRVVALRFRVCITADISGLSVNSSSSENLFSGLIMTNDNEIFSPPIDISSGRTSTSGKPLASNIFEYQYEINPKLAKAEPLFGYTVQRLNQKKRVAAGWSNILIGQTLAGKELYASEKSDLKLQRYFTHNIYAGSRSGKGVMTMNILANALASNRPIFYLDRKPDMASMLYRLSGGRQFIVNGGLHNPEYDPGKCFSESDGVAMQAWRDISKPFLEANPRIAEFFGGSGQSYYISGVVGDYIYFRAFMFVLGLCVLRAKLKGSGGKLEAFRDNELNGNDGIVIIVDELTGFQANIKQLLSDFSSPLVKAAIRLGNADDIIEKRRQLESKIAYTSKQIDEAKKESAAMKAESDVATLRHQLESLIDEQSLYASTLFKKISDSYSTMISMKVAGFKNKEFNYSDIFVLGQQLDSKFYASYLSSAGVVKNMGSISPVFFPLLSSGDDYYSSFKGADFVRSFLEELGQEDWFLGRNEDFDYAQKKASPAVVQCLDGDGNWEYVGARTCSEITGAVLSDFSSPILFKPYLVLNTHLEANPPKDGEGDYQYVAQCAARVAENSDIADMWESVRLKHVSPEIRSRIESNPNDKCYGHLNEGIGFKGLVAETLATTESGRKNASRIDDYIVEVLSRSGDIADKVAKAMGYPNGWQSLIFDLSVDGLFSFNDMITAVTEPERYTREFRLPLHSKLGLLGNDISQSGLNNGASESFADMFGEQEPASSPVNGQASSPVNQSDMNSTFSDSGSSSDWAQMRRDADEQFHGGAAEEQTDEEDQYDSSYEDDYDDESTSYNPYGQSAVDEHEILLFARNVVEVAVVASGKQFSDDEINELIEFVFQMTIELMEEG